MTTPDINAVVLPLQEPAYYTLTQLQAYATAAVLADRERRAPLLGANASFQRAAREYAEEYAEIAVAAEREACAMACESVHVHPIQGAHKEYISGKQMAIIQAASLIRKRAGT